MLGTDHISEASSLFVARNMDSIVGHIAGEYSCTWEDCNGTLYAGSKGVYFYGSYFLFERKVVLYWPDVRSVQRMEQGIEVIGNDDAVHQFCGIPAPDRVWSMLVSMHSDALLDRRGRRASRISPLSSSMRRRNSDPSFQSCRKLGELLSPAAEKAEIQRDNDNSNNNNNNIKLLADEGAPQQSVCAPAPVPPTAAPITTSAPDITPMKQSTTATPSVRVVIHPVSGKLHLPAIPCTFEKTVGTLYIGENCLYFEGQGSFLFWDKKAMTLHWERVQRIERIDALMHTASSSSSTSQQQGDNDALVMKCAGLRLVDKDEVSFEFVSINNADDTWSSLVELHREKLLKLPQQRPRPHRRTNSDPLQSSQLQQKFTFDNDDDDDDDSQTSPQPSTTTPEAALDQSSNNKLSAKEHEAEWSKVLQKSDQYTRVVIKEQVLPCTLDQFFDFFLADTAQHSLAQFMQNGGDKSLNATAWKSQDATGAYSRVVSYKHPVNVPMAPPEAKARKEQTYRRFGNHGLVLETKTYVEDVPMTDCFYVADRLVVQPNQDNPNQQVSITHEFGMTFVKSTMFKSIISRTTEGEFVSFIQRYTNNLSKALSELVVIPKDDDEPVKAVPVPGQQEPVVVQPPPAQIATPPPQPPRIPVVPILLVLVTLMQAWIMLELRGIKASLRSLQNSMPVDTPAAVNCAIHEAPPPHLEYSEPQL